MTEGPGVFSDEKTLELPPGYKTVTLQIKKLEKEYDDDGNKKYNNWEFGDKINEIIDFINKSQITVTGNPEFLEQFKEWIQ